MNADVAPHSALFYIAIAAFIGWRIYKRVRRLVGRQALHPVRPWLTLIVFPLLLTAFSLVALAHPVSLGALAGGLALGVGLGVYGHKLTRFEVTPDGLFYTPNAHLGIALSLLFVGRVGYRLFHAFILGQGDMAGTPQDFGSSPLTLAIFGTLAGYYMAYAAGLLIWKRSLKQQPPQP